MGDLFKLGVVWFFAIVPAMADVRVVAWGSGSGTNMPPGLTTVVALANGASHSLALRSDGTVTAWGGSVSGQTNVPPGLSNVVAVAGGGNHSLALRSDGTVIAWGANGSGQTNVPTSLGNVVAVAGGLSHSLALRADGTVTAWGSGSSGQTNVPAGLTNVIAIAAGGNHSLALRADGTVVVWGSNGSGQRTIPASLSNAVALAVAGGLSHSLALRDDGTVVAWGSSSSGQTNVPAGLSNVVAITAGLNHSLALKENGTLTAWGITSSGQSTVPAGLSNVVTMSGGDAQSLALSGSLAPFLTRIFPAQTVLASQSASFTANFLASPPVSFQWQLNGTILPGATNRTLILSNLVTSQSGSYSVIVGNPLGTAISPGEVLNVVPLIFDKDLQSQTAFLAGTVHMDVSCQSVLPLTYQWRLAATNLPGAIEDFLTLTNVTYGQAGSYTVVASNSAGSVVSDKGVLAVVPLAAWGRNTEGATTVPPGLSNVVAMAGGSVHSLALRFNGTVAAWGSGSATNVPPNLSNVVALASGPTHALALGANGSVTAWGANDAGQTNVPPGLTNAVGIACGNSHSLALTIDGTTVAWGLNTAGQTHVPGTLSNVVALAAGNDFSLALRSDGTVMAWGDNTWGQTNIPPGLSNVVAVAATSSKALALRIDGTVAAWGRFSPSETNGLQSLNNVVAVATGEDGNMALRRDGTVIAWGDNTWGQTNVPSWVTGVGGIASGSAHHLAAPAIGAPFVTSRLATRRAAPEDRVFFRVEANGEQPLRYQWRWNDVDLSGQTNAVLQLTGIGLADEGDYSVTVSNALGVVTVPSGRLLVPKSVFQVALDNILVWITSGTNGWFSTATPTHDSVSATQSGAITNNQESWIQTSVTGPGRLTWWWKVSSELDYDFLEFYIDTTLQPGRISGEVDWQRQTNSIPAGTHTLRWRYMKDVADSGGSDAAWLDEVTFVELVRFQLTTRGGGPSVSNGAFHLRLLGPVGTSVVVENSFNLTDWWPWQTNLLPAGGLNLTIPIGANGRQFFRATAQP